MAVLGGSLQASAAAYALARRGRRVLLLEHCVGHPPAEGLRAPLLDCVLHLPASDAHLVT